MKQIINVLYTILTQRCERIYSTWWKNNILFKTLLERDKNKQEKERHSRKSISRFTYFGNSYISQLSDIFLEWFSDLWRHRINVICNHSGTLKYGTNRVAYNEAKSVTPSNINGLTDFFKIWNAWNLFFSISYCSSIFHKGNVKLPNVKFSFLHSCKFVCPIPYTLIKSVFNRIQSFPLFVSIR